MKTNYLLIDYENVQPASLAALKDNEFRILVFLGANQTKVPIEFAKTLQALGSDAEYIQISGNGTNALDFHIAFTIGELSKSEPDAYFHIISKDTGFDPLIKYVKKKGIHIVRSKDIADIPLLKLSNANSMDEKIEAIVQNLTSRGGGRPRRVKTLTNTINALFRKSLDESELKVLIEMLNKHGHIDIEGENVSYTLSAPS